MELRLISVVPNGFGDIQATAINLIYSSLLERYKIVFYDFILINQIGHDLNELITIENRNAHINIQYPFNEKFQLEKGEERNLTRLNLIHLALTKLAEQDKRIEISKLEEIKNEIIQNNFSFYFECKFWPNKKEENLIAKIVLNPKEERFDYYVLIIKDNKEKCKKMIHSTRPNNHQNHSNFFYYGKWVNNNHLQLSGKLKEIKFNIYIDQCEIEYINLSNYVAPPHFDSLRPYISPALPISRDKDYEEWFYSLPSQWTNYFFHIATQIGK